MDANGYEGTWLTAEQCIECGLADELAAYDIDPQEAMRRLQEAQAKTDAAPQQATAYSAAAALQAVAAALYAIPPVSYTHLMFISFIRRWIRLREQESCGRIR